MFAWLLTTIGCLQVPSGYRATGVLVEGALVTLLGALMTWLCWREAREKRVEIARRLTRVTNQYLALLTKKYEGCCGTRW